jgi:Spy/CpxP family protein refolding chaperone
MHARAFHLFAARPWRLMSATLLIAMAATAAQTALAQPQAGHGGRHHAVAHHGGHGGGYGMLAPRHLDRMLDSVNASAEQRTQIRQIVEAARNDLRAQHDGSRALREQARALFVQPTVDARAAEALRQQMVARHDARSKRMLQAMLDVSRVLTPEQRQQLAQRMEQRKAMMERHRAERQQLERGQQR